MKFIKTPDGYRINPAQVRYFQIRSDGQIRAIFGLIVRNDGVVLDYGAFTFDGGKSRTEAEAFLDKCLEGTK